MHLKTSVAVGVGAVVLSTCTLGTTQTTETVADDAVARGKIVYAKECAQCHGSAGEGGGPASLGLGVVPPDLVALSARNGGVFPRAYIRQYVLGLTEDNDSAGPMPDFARVGLRHVYPNGGADGELLEADFEGMLDDLEAIQN